MNLWEGRRRILAMSFFQKLEKPQANTLLLSFGFFFFGMCGSTDAHGRLPLKKEVSRASSAAEVCLATRECRPSSSISVSLSSLPSLSAEERLATKSVDATTPEEAPEDRTRLRLRLIERAREAMKNHSPRSKTTMRG